MRTLAVGCLLVLAIYGMAGSRPESPEAALLMWVDALDAEDQRALAALHTPDAVLHRADGRDLVGGTEIARDLLAGSLVVGAVGTKTVTPSEDSVLLESVLTIKTGPQALVESSSTALRAYLFWFEQTGIKRIHEFELWMGNDSCSDWCIQRWEQAVRGTSTTGTAAAADILRLERRMGSGNSRLARDWDQLFAADALRMSVNPFDAGIVHPIELAYVAGRGERAYALHEFSGVFVREAFDRKLLVVVDVVSGKIQTYVTYQSFNQAATTAAIREVIDS